MRISADCIDHEAKNPNNSVAAAEGSALEIERPQLDNCSTMDESKNQRQIGVTHQSRGTKTCPSMFKKDRSVKIPFPDPNTSWCCFRTRLLQACSISPSSEVEILYLDEEEDKIHINSEDEFLEAMRVAEHMKPFVLIVKEKCTPKLVGATAKESRMENLKPRSFKVISDTKGYSSDSDDDLPQPHEVNSSMPVFDVTGPPKWFESYMNKMEGNIVHKVCTEVQEMLLAAVDILRTDDQRVEQKSPAVMNEDEGVLHEGITCDCCEQVIRGVRYKCETCEDFDLCMKCEALPNVHIKDHLFLKIRQPLHGRGAKHSSMKPGKSGGPTFPNQSDDQQVANLPLWISRPELYYGPRMKHEKQKMVKVMKKLAKRSAGHPLAAVKVRSTSLSADSASHPWSERRHTEPTLVRELGLPKYSTRNLMDAQFIEDGNVPDGMLMPPGERFVKCWKVRNTGTKSWNSHTSLKYCWGTAGLIPKSKEVHVPHLKPLDEGVLSVEFVAPTKPGRYQSHWRLYHRCYAFGHQLWCNIEVAPSAEALRPPTDKEQKPIESQSIPIEKISKKPTEVTDDIAQALSVVQVEQENGQLGGRKKVVISHTTTPTNTPFDMTPPKSPEPHPKEAPKFAAPLEIPNSKLNLADAEKDKLSDGEDTASVLSLSSSDSDTEFVVIPNPSPFGIATFRTYTPTAVSEQMSCSQYSLMTTDSFEMVRRKSGVNSGNGDEETCKTSTVSEHPASSSSDIATADSSGGEDYPRADKMPPYPTVTECVTPRRLSEPLSVTDDVKSGVDTRTGEDFSVPRMQPSDPSSAQMEERITQDSGPEVVGASSAAMGSVPAVTTTITTTAAATVTHRSMTTGDAVTLNPTAASVISKTASTSINPQAYTNAVTSQENRTIDVLPEGLVHGALNAAATVYNTTREFISSIQRQNDPPDSFQASSPQSPPEWIPPSRQTMTPMENLVEMGFCNLALNESLLEKHKGDVAEVVAELVATSDNDWFAHRHTPETQQLTFD